MGGFSCSNCKCNKKEDMNANDELVLNDKNSKGKAKDKIINSVDFNEELARDSKIPNDIITSRGGSTTLHRNGISSSNMLNMDNNIIGSINKIPNYDDQLHMNINSNNQCELNSLNDNNNNNNNNNTLTNTIENTYTGLVATSCQNDNSALPEDAKKENETTNNNNNNINNNNNNNNHIEDILSESQVNNFFIENFTNNNNTLNNETNSNNNNNNNNHRKQILQIEKIDFGLGNRNELSIEDQKLYDQAQKNLNQFYAPESNEIKAIHKKIQKISLKTLLPSTKIKEINENDNTLVFHGEIKKLVNYEINAHKTQMYSSRFCVLTPKLFRYYKSKEQFLKNLRPSCTIPLLHITRINFAKVKKTAKKTDHIILCNRLGIIKNKDKIKHDNLLIQNVCDMSMIATPESNESLVIFTSEIEEVIYKWFMMIQFFVNRENRDKQ